MQGDSRLSSSGPWFSIKKFRFFFRLLNGLIRPQMQRNIFKFWTPPPHNSWSSQTFSRFFENVSKVFLLPLNAGGRPVNWNFPFKHIFNFHFSAPPCSEVWGTQDPGFSNQDSSPGLASSFLQPSLSRSESTHIEPGTLQTIFLHQPPLGLIHIIPARRSLFLPLAGVKCNRAKAPNSQYTFF